MAHLDSLNAPGLQLHGHGLPWPSWPACSAVHATMGRPILVLKRGERARTTRRIMTQRQTRITRSAAHIVVHRGAMQNNLFAIAGLPDQITRTPAFDWDAWFQSDPWGEPRTLSRYEDTDNNPNGTPEPDPVGSAPHSNSKTRGPNDGAAGLRNRVRPH